ncbi:hypothetical protein SAMN02982931_02377 [Bauldia litoralis]|uniref:Uncharacterized protein n=1 Tax=Bauldia litoralis TaxID=665467 RepID=A0A1G6CE72_9HYPH|nr:hypothetical protein SAMN02982931_02377 [Bauldia litoralis]
MCSLCGTQSLIRLRFFNGFRARFSTRCSALRAPCLEVRDNNFTEYPPVEIGGANKRVFRLLHRNAPRRQERMWIRRRRRGQVRLSVFAGRVPDPMNVVVPQFVYRRELVDDLIENLLSGNIERGRRQERPHDIDAQSLGRDRPEDCVRRDFCLVASELRENVDHRFFQVRPDADQLADDLSKFRIMYAGNKLPVRWAPSRVPVESISLEPDQRL